MKPYINLIDIQWKIVNLPEEYDLLRRLLRDMLEFKVHQLQALGHLRKDAFPVTKREPRRAGSELRYSAEMSIEEERGNNLLRRITPVASINTLPHARTPGDTGNIRSEGFLDSHPR